MAVCARPDEKLPMLSRVNAKLTQLRHGGPSHDSEALPSWPTWAGDDLEFRYLANVAVKKGGWLSTRI